MKAALASLINRKNRSKTAFDVEEELQFHLEMLEHKFTRHGMSSADARAAALRRFGNPDKIKNQCLEICRGSSPLRGVLKVLSVLLAFTGLAIHIFSSDYKVAHVGDTLTAIAITGRLLLYVRGLTPSIFLPATKQGSLSVVSNSSDDSSN